jgi:hypothetical protein
MRTLHLLVVILSLLSLSHNVSGEQVEIHLIDPVDEDRRYCIDIKGHKSKAKIQRGLQAHTCYSYQGKIAVDQAFDSLSFGENGLYLSVFDVCVRAESMRVEASLQLERCREGEELQKFGWDDKRRIYAIANPRLCIAVSQGEPRKGGGGTPVHLIRNLSLQFCSASLTHTQQWGFRKISY